MTTAIPVGELEASLEPGAYVLTARAVNGTDNDWEARATQWFVVTDLGLTTLAGNDGLNVMVRSLGTAGPVGDVGLRLVAVKVDGKPVEYVGQLQQVIGFRKPGELVKVEVARKGGVRKTIGVKLQALNDTPQVAAGDGHDSPGADTAGGTAMGRLGISVEPIGPDAAVELQLPADTRGLIVTDVTPGGPAWEVLFDDPQRGGPDIILSVEGKPVRTEADLRKVLQTEKPGSIVTLRIFNPRAQSRRVERIRLADGQ
jgi:S1-C subfamily serine protease